MLNLFDLELVGLKFHCTQPTHLLALRTNDRAKQRLLASKALSEREASDVHLLQG